MHCHFTEDRSYFNNPNLKVLNLYVLVRKIYIVFSTTQAIIFYGSNFNRTDLPLPRLPHIEWILFHEESPKNELIFSHSQMLRLFNATATFSSHSDFPLTLQYLPGIKELRNLKYMQSVMKKNEHQIDDQLASVLYVQTICDTMSGRDDYVQELMKYINVDSYGGCLNNKKLSEK